MSSHHKSRGGSSRRALLAAAAVGTLAVVSGRALRRAHADTVGATGPVADGVDYSWGRPRPSQLRAAGYTFACRYLSFNTTGKNLTRPEAQALIAAGVSIVCNWEYQADEALNGYAQGITNAREAIRQAWICGMPARRPIYFSVDFDAQPADQPAINAYFDGVASVLGRALTGAYGGYHVIQRLFDANKIVWGWQTYAWSGGLWEPRAQLRQVQTGIHVDGEDCDRDEAWATDVGQWDSFNPHPPAVGPTTRPADPPPRLSPTG